MADLHPTVTESASPLTRKIEALAHKGYTSSEVAQKLAPNDARRRKIIRQRYRRVVAERPSIIRSQGMVAQGAFIENFEPIADALVRRARRGRVDAAKLIFEMTGFHNPRVKHEHSGELSIKISGLPRPKAVETEDSVISDAEEVTDQA